LRDPAMHLALQQQRVDDRAEIVDDEIARDLDMSGIGVDLDLADMATIRKGRLRRREVAALGKAGLELRRQLPRVEGGARHRLDSDGPVRAGDRENAVL